MTIEQLITKWKKAELKERAAAQEHFLDLCHLLDHPTPAEADSTGTHVARIRKIETVTSGLAGPKEHRLLR